jgi:hypothetical protein
LNSIIDLSPSKELMKSGSNEIVDSGKWTTSNNRQTENRKWATRNNGEWTISAKKFIPFIPTATSAMEN